MTPQVNLSARSENVGTLQRGKCQEIFLKKLELLESDKPPGTHILFISDFSLGSSGSQVSHVTSPFGNNDSAVFAVKIIQSDPRYDNLCMRSLHDSVLYVFL